MAKYGKQTRYKYICYPDNLEIIVIIMSHDTATICIKKFSDKKNVIFKKSYTLEGSSRKEVDKLVKEFSEYFIGRFVCHSENHIKKVASELGSVSTPSGLLVWKRKRIKKKISFELN